MGLDGQTPCGTIGVEILPEGDVEGLAVGEHVVLEAASGALLQALRLADCFFAIRSGRVQTFQVARKLPAASVVRYPPPFNLELEADRAAVLHRARQFVGLDVSTVGHYLQEDPTNEALLTELLITFCVTGMHWNWRVAEAHKAERHFKAAQGSRNPFVGGPRPISNVDELSGNDSPETAKTQMSSKLRQAIPERVQEKAVSTAIHVGCRGSAARAAGAAAAMTVEGYALYKEIGKHCEQLEEKNISSDQFAERICESTVSSSGRAIGSLAGAAVGQASIPVPVVGAVIGGVAGAACGGFYANSLVRGAWRLSGGPAKGGDGIVRCVEHSVASESKEADQIQDKWSPPHALL
ncbi:unnamed protein product [Durusdinium trenchii]|uniref:Uncharacterized protein n=4 Tax=Durusdinium trenchii TaxID=1381693 RepID=A0ABP0JJM1_9DINO